MAARAGRSRAVARGSRWRAAARPACGSPRRCRRGSRRPPAPSCARGSSRTGGGDWRRARRRASRAGCATRRDRSESSSISPSVRSFSVARVASRASNAAASSFSRAFTPSSCSKRPIRPSSSWPVPSLRDLDLAADGGRLPSRCGCGSDASADPSSWLLRRRACLRCRGGAIRDRHARRGTASSTWRCAASALVELGDLAPERLDRVGTLTELQIDGLQVDQQLDLISQSLSSRTVKNGPTRTRTWDQPVMSRSL